MKYFIKIVLLFAQLGMIFAQVYPQSVHGPPKVSISFPDVGDVDFQNETVAYMSNSNAAFVMECNASYPIEWIFHYSEEDDGTSEKLKLANTYRYAEDFLNPSTYTYVAKLRLEYQGKLLVFANFTCKATESDLPQRQTHVLMKDENKKNVIRLEMTDKAPTQNKIEFPESNDCSRAVATVEYTTKSPCWTCEVPNVRELELDFEPCQTPIQCNSMHMRHKNGKRCLKTIEDDERDCKTDGLLAYHPKMVLCKNFGPALAQFYFFGVFRGEIYSRKTVAPPIYYSWQDADEKEMLNLHKFKEDVYVGEEITFTCEYSRYYFSLGSWFVIRTPSGDHFVKAFDIKPCETDAEAKEASELHNCNETDLAKRRGSYTASLLWRFEEKGIHRVHCNGPVWNSTKWVETSLPVYVKDGAAPVISEVEKDKKDYFIIGQNNRSLTCRFGGLPPPKVDWIAPPKSVHTVVDGEGSSTLVFGEVGYQTSGRYTCIVSNFLGNHSESIIIESHLPSNLSGGGIAGIVIVCLILAVTFVVVVVKMRMIIVRQKKALRLLTDAEVDAFLLGDPDLAASKGKSDYIDNPLAIDALAYDQKYEIPHERLSVDYSTVLGSGEFGLVLKGNVQAQNAVHYVNMSMTLPETPIEARIRSLDEALYQEDAFEVAVKICKKNVDVTNFKSLLSEVKVMAYLGQHKNIVSLIGASTNNIKNRELFIAVEFCQNGGLDSYLRKRKEKFVNKVKYGFFEPEEEQSAGYINLVEESFSSIDLFKWARDIAAGVEYIHSKRVIHGDLAIRNVLLTKQYVAKVGDFGLSRQLGNMSNYIKTTQCPLPWRNMAIESLREMDFSPKSDIWAMGVTLWELFTLGEVPYPGLNYNMNFISDLENGTVRLFKPPNATNDIYEYLLMCWEKKPQDRPTPVEMIILCDKLLQKVPSRNAH